MNPLRFATIGSVDDGKSTLIGRLLFDSKAIFDDQLEHITAVSERRGDDYLDLALLTDGLRAEREQGITIDVAYRYFATPARSFVIADCPGHVQYTRNMVTGASNVDLAIVLVDVRHGIVEQTRRHTVLAALLGVPHLVICVNKMDLVGYSAEAFQAVCDEFTRFAARLDLHDVTFIPLSALTGDNVTARSTEMPWYGGSSLLHHLEHVYTASDDNLVDVRFPVQYVIRPQRNDARDYRGYAGTVAGGVLRVGDELVALPSGLPVTVAGLDTPTGPTPEAKAGEAIVVRLADNIDLGRGDMLCRPRNRPAVTQDIEAMICWLDTESSLTPRSMFGLQHTSRHVRAMVTELQYELDITTLHRRPDPTVLTVNGIGRIALRTTAPLMTDDYHRNRTTGSFILIDEQRGTTLAAGMIIDRSR
jgi:bifunctional enzyme CysN/CysC